MGALELAMIDDMSQKIEGSLSVKTLNAYGEFEIGDAVAVYGGNAYLHSENNLFMSSDFFKGYADVKVSPIDHETYLYIAKNDSTSTTAYYGIVQVKNGGIVKLSSISLSIIAGGFINVVSNGNAMFIITEGTTGVATIRYGLYDPTTKTIGALSVVTTFAPKANFYSVTGWESLRIIPAGSGIESVAFIDFKIDGTVAQSTSTLANTRYFDGLYGVCYDYVRNKLYGHGYYSSDYCFSVGIDPITLVISNVSTLSAPSGYTWNKTYAHWYDSINDAIGMLAAQGADAAMIDVIYVNPSSTSQFKSGMPITNLGKYQVPILGSVTYKDGDNYIIANKTQVTTYKNMLMIDASLKVTKTNQPIVSNNAFPLYFNPKGMQFLCFDSGAYASAYAATASSFIDERGIVIDKNDINTVEVRPTESEVGQLKRIENIVNGAATTLRFTPMNINKTSIYPPISAYTPSALTLAANSYQVIEYK